MDGEIILENSPLHKYLLEIGYNDTETVKAVYHSKVNTDDDKTSCLQNLIGKLKALISLFITQQDKFNTLLISVEALLVTDHFKDLKFRDDSLASTEHEKIKLLSIRNKFLSSSLLICLLLFCLNSVLINSIICVYIASIFSVQGILKYNEKKHLNHILSLQSYTKTVLNVKTKIKMTLSFIRDFQVSKNLSVAGVTWNKLDALERKKLLELPQLRNQVFKILEELFNVHKKVIIDIIDTYPLTTELDIRGRYIVFESVDESDDITCLNLRYRFRLVEHVISELMWRMIVGNITASWHDLYIPSGYNSYIISTIFEITRLLHTYEDKLTYNLETNKTISSPLLGATKQNDSNDVLRDKVCYELQVLGSFLNVATLRCSNLLEGYSKKTERFSAKELEEIAAFTDLTNVSIDSVSHSLDKISTMLDSQYDEQLSESKIYRHNVEICDEGKMEAPLIVPYQQEGNVVFEAVPNEIDESNSEDDQDTEYDFHLAAHKNASKILMVELKHTIESNPTQLYDKDYDELKRQGLVNPLKRDLVTSRKEDEEYLGSRTIGMNSIMADLQNNLRNELLTVRECFGDLSDEEEKL